MFGVMFDDKHSYDDFGLIYNTKTISEPVVQKKYVSVPGRNGAIDLSEVLTGNPRYDDREINVTFTIMEPFPKWELKRSEIAQALHGRKMRIVFDDDKAFYWYGRIEVGEIKPEGSTASIEISAIVEPYKHNVTTSAEDWLWDPFDFEFGVINETANMLVNGTLSYILITSQKWENPIIVSDAAMSLTVDGKTYSIAAGSQVLYELILTEGEHTFTFTGNGTVTINYVGGML